MNRVAENLKPATGLRNRNCICTCNGTRIHIRTSTSISTRTCILICLCIQTGILHSHGLSVSPNFPILGHQFIYPYNYT